ncbi:homocysteine-responsive endoplasmic reticulum-resident ubiquitin-like domain member 2 protein isoform X6 [Phyllobates terribilis]|uniref:homocysteine-responsive endoplasmic reticulum-resident ubiquitin-like domain member 2 protein isoform X6 n=1 Tax=Phyllobates terribilis TaxID=111132 RepID=UPI003CCAE250
MEQAVMDNPVTLVIKAPNQKYDDQTINCFLEWTVEKLKSHLSKVYPSKPLTKDQRLVYSGKLLLDHLRLKDVLRKQDEYHMVHLVCASRTPPNSPKPSTSRANTRAEKASCRSNSEHSGSSPSVSTSCDMSSTASNSRNEENLRHRHNPPMYTDAMHNHSFLYNRQPHQAGWFPFRQEDGQPQARDEAGDVNPDRVNNNDLLEMERRMDEGVQEDAAEERGDDAPEVEPPGLVASAWSFITTFFTSLIPEGPPQVVN